MTDLYPNLFKNLTRNPITVILLDGRKQMMVYDKTTKLKTLFEETCSLCNLDFDNLFGFATLMDDYYAFLNLETKVSKINFKEISRKSQSNVLFQSDLAFYAPTHRVFEENRRLSQGNKLSRDSNKLMQSTSSTKSAPVYNGNDTLTTPQNNTPVIYFRVKSYVESHCLRDRVTKSLYFLQLLRNVLDFKLKCVDEIYLQLGALAIQAFFGDYHSLVASSSYDDRNSAVSSNNESSDYSHSPTMARLPRISTLTFNFTTDEVRSGRYFEPKKFFPSWIIEKYSDEYLYKEMPQLHRGLSGLSRAEAEFSYIRMASAQYSNFNMHLCPVRDQKLSGNHMTLMAAHPILATNKRNGVTGTKNSLWLGLSPAGLEMHQMKRTEYIEHLSILKWSDIDEVTHKSSRISIRIGCRSLKLHTNSKLQADNLFWLTRHMHMCQTKARLNATCTEEALENAERQKYREKYVYQDLEDLKQHGLLTYDTKNSPRMVSQKDSPESSSVVRLPLVNTPVAPPRRTPSKAKPLKIKDLMKMANSSNDSVNGSPGGSFHGEKHCQYIKKCHPRSSNHSSVHNTTLSLDTGASVVTNDQQCSDQRNVNVIEYMEEESDLSESRSSTVFVTRPSPGRFVSLSRDRYQESLVLSPPQEFRGSVYSRHSQRPGKSSYFRVTAISRHQSYPDIRTSQMSDTEPLYDLGYEFKVIDQENKPSSSSIAMKSWKSEVLFNLSTCGNDTDDEHVMRARDDRLTSLPRQVGSYRDLISLSSSSSSSSSLSGASVEISSLSSFEMNEVKYSRAQVSIN